MVMAALFAGVALGSFSLARGSRGGPARQTAAWENEAWVNLRERYHPGEIGRTEFEHAKRELSHKTPWAA